MRKVAFSSAALIIALSFVRVTFALIVRASQQALDLASRDKITVSVTTRPNVIASIFVRSNPPAGQAIASSQKTLLAMTPEQLHGSSLSAELPSAPPNSVDITGRSTGYTEVGYEFTATVRPKSTTRPVTFTWQVSDLGSFTRIVTDSLYDTQTFTWAVPGNKIITVVAGNGDKTVDDVHIVNIQPQPLDDIAINGTQAGTINTAYNFTAIASPPNAYKPITYTWSPPPNSGQGPVVTYTWTTTGIKIFSVVATNAANNAVTGTHVVAIDFSPKKVYLPSVLRDACFGLTLFPIENDDNDGSYVVRWCASGAEYYVLEETVFGSISPMVVYSDSDTYAPLSDRGPTRYYYRVKSISSSGSNRQSNEESVDVLWELEPNNYIDGPNAPDESNGPLLSGLWYYGKPGPVDDKWDCFRFFATSAGLITVDLENHTGQQIHLALFFQIENPDPIQDTTPPYHIEHFGAAGRYYACIYSENGDPDAPYRLKATFPQ
ncbi:MAG TPA: hypothetical protein VFL17_22650 [Anaerolineae bacterium]|nr:hypothetical protein [Anaerolineae bacterium]